MATHNIFVHKAGVEGESVVSTASPANEAGTSPKSATKNTVLIQYGTMAARQALSTITQDLRASGNEEIATTISNVSTVATMALAAYATGGLSLIANAIQGASTAIIDVRNTARENRNRDYAERLRGARVSNNMGGGLSD